MISKALALAATYLGFHALVSRVKLPQECLLSFEESCQKNGYKVESHWVTTKDGYHLRLYRLGKSTFSSGPPVLLVHGLVQSSSNFITCRSTTPPAYYLANQDFDVWLLNTRGNHLSRLHKTLSPSDKKFWEWSAYDIGLNDLPTSIDYVLAQTNYKQLNYIGHSQGGHVLLTLLSYLPEYNSKVNVAALMAPVGGTMAGGGFFNNKITKLSLRLMEMAGINVVADYSHQGNFIAKLTLKFPRLGALLTREYYDPNITNDKIENLPYYLQKMPNGTSLQNIKYYAQMKQKKSPLPFAYDYGVNEKNMQKYGQITPPRADFSKIASKLALFYGLHDSVITLKDANKLINQLPKAAVVFKDLECNLDHGGFMISNSQSHFQKIAEIMNSHKINK